MSDYQLKLKVVDALNTLSEQDVVSNVETTNAINTFFDETEKNRGLVKITQHKVLDELVAKYGELVVYSSIVNKILTSK